MWLVWRGRGDDRTCGEGVAGLGGRTVEIGRALGLSNPIDHGEARTTKKILREWKRKIKEVSDVIVDEE